MKTKLYLPGFFLTLLLTMGAFPGCYTQVATTEDEAYSDGSSYRETQRDSSDTTANYDNYADWTYRPRYTTGFHYYYPWRYSFYWVANDPWYCDPWYDSWYYDSWYYAPWHFPHYSYYYPGYYSPYYYTPGYYSYYQPYIANRGVYTRRQSGTVRTGGMRDGYTRTGSYGTSTTFPTGTRSRTIRSTGDSRDPGLQNRRTETGYTRGSGSTNRTSGDRSSTTSTSTTRRERNTEGSTRSSGSTRTESSRSRDQSSSRPSSSYSPPSSSSSGGGSSRSSGGSSGGGGSTRSSGSTRGNR